MKKLLVAALVLLGGCKASTWTRVLSTSEVGVAYGGTDITTPGVSRYEADSVSLMWTVRPWTHKAEPERVRVVEDAGRVASTLREVAQIRSDLASALQVGEDLKAELIQLRLVMATLAAARKE